MSRGRFLVAVCSALLAVATAEAGGMRPFTAGSLTEIEAARSGQPFVLVFWSVSCAPCVAELPKWAARQKRHRRVPVLLVNLDPAEEEAAALARLRGGGLRGLELWRLAEDVPERVYWAVDPKWHGETPYVRLFDGQRRAVGALGALDEAWVERWYQAALKPGAAARRDANVSSSTHVEPAVVPLSDRMR